MPTAQVLLEARDRQAIRSGMIRARSSPASSIAWRADGYHPVIACELEFYLVDGKRQDDGTFRPPIVPRNGRPMEYPVNAASLPAEDFAVFFDKVREAARLQDVSAGLVYVEYGLGQFEINLDHSNDPVRAADEAVLRSGSCAVSRARSVSTRPSWPKPYGAEAGSGFHMHMSLTDAAGDNLFARPDGVTLLRHAIGGMKRMLPDTLSFFVPNANSFKRAGAVFAPVNLAWGARTTGRSPSGIPAGSPKARRRIEQSCGGCGREPLSRGGRHPRRGPSGHHGEDRSGRAGRRPRRVPA